MTDPFDLGSNQYITPGARPNYQPAELPAPIQLWLAAQPEWLQACLKLSFNPDWHQTGLRDILAEAPEEAYALVQERAVQLEQERAEIRRQHNEVLKFLLPVIRGHRQDVIEALGLELRALIRDEVYEVARGR